MNTILEIKQLILKLSIGVEQQEREKLQDIEFNIVINFSKTPEACSSDKIEETICYSGIVDEIKLFCSNNYFYLIENLCSRLHKHLKEKFLLPQDKLTLQVCKKPPIADISGKCCFTTSSV